MHYLITGGACRGKTTLALWLCGRLPRPMAGLRTLCTGRCAAGPRFSLQDLATGRQEPLDRETAGQLSPRPEAMEALAVPALQDAARQETPTVLVDEAGRLAENPVCRQLLAALAGGAATLVVTAGPGDLPLLAPLCDGNAVTRIDLDAVSLDRAQETLAQTLPAPLHAGVSVRLFREEKCFGAGPLQLLELVGRTGSLHKAAAAMGMAYSKAWKMLGALEAQWGFAMLQRHPGGVGGGGSLLTPRAWELVARYRALRWDCDRAAQAAFDRHFGSFGVGTDADTET